MKHLIIRNVGPIKCADFAVKRFNFFIGPQSSGKSTIAKILSTCSWIEKETATTMDEAAVSDANSFQSLIEDYHKMTDYFDEKSEILYETDVIYLHLNGSSFELKLKNQEAYQREKICYIPSERNAVTLPELQGIEFGHTNLRSFLFDWYKAREYFNSDNKIDILNLGIRYFFDSSKNKYKDRVEHENGKSYQISLGSASSGLQSAVPLQVMILFFTGHYFDSFAEKISYDSESKSRLIRQRVIDKYVLNVSSDIKLEERLRMINEINNRLHNGDSSAWEMIRLSNEEFRRLTVPVRTSFIIEEPEQNLYPSSQRILLNYIVSCCNGRQAHSFAITTHSPYIINQLNLLIKAFDKNLPIDGAALNFDDLNVFAVQDGEIRDLKIQNEGVRLIDTSRLSEDINDIYEQFSTL